MTLMWMPTSIKGLSVGKPMKLTVTGAGLDDRIQAVSVVTNEANARTGHVTISHKQDAAPDEANSLEFNATGDGVALDGPMQFSPVEPFTLDGVVGVGVILGGADKETLPDRILDRVTALTEGQPGKSECFDNVTDSQRYALHLLADELRLEHRSEGKKGSQYRKLILTVPRRWKKPQVEGHADFDRTVLKGSQKFA